MLLFGLFRTYLQAHHVDTNLKVSIRLQLHI